MLKYILPFVSVGSFSTCLQTDIGTSSFGIAFPFGSLAFSIGTWILSLIVLDFFGVASFPICLWP